MFCVDAEAISWADSHLQSCTENILTVVRTAYTKISLELSWFKTAT